MAMSDLSEEQFDAEFPKETHTKSVYTFTKAELALVNTYQTILTMGQMARTLIDNLLNGVCLPRVGKQSRQGMGVFYSNSDGTFTVYEPKPIQEKKEK